MRFVTLTELKALRESNTRSAGELEKLAQDQIEYYTRLINQFKEFSGEK